VPAVPTTGQEATTSTARRIHGSTIACVLLAFAMTTAATAKPLQDHRSPDARDTAQTPDMSETTSEPPHDPRPRTRATPRPTRDEKPPGAAHAGKRQPPTNQHRACCGRHASASPDAHGARAFGAEQ